MSGLQQGPSNHDIHSHVSKSLEDIGLLTTEEDQEEQEQEDEQEEAEQEEEEQEDEQDEEEEQEEDEQETLNKELVRTMVRRSLHKVASDIENEEDFIKAFSTNMIKNVMINASLIDGDDVSDTKTDATSSVNDLLSEEEQKAVLKALNKENNIVVKRSTIAKFLKKPVKTLTGGDMLQYFQARFNDPSQKTMDEFMQQRQTRASSSKDP
eukprot:6187550-Pleurochrysis_carterae.AAC.2